MVGDDCPLLDGSFPPLHSSPVSLCGAGEGVCRSLFLAKVRKSQKGAGFIFNKEYEGTRIAKGKGEKIYIYLEK